MVLLILRPRITGNTALFRGAALRCLFCYLALYFAAVPFLLNGLTPSLWNAYLVPCRAVAAWVARNVLGLDAQLGAFGAGLYPTPHDHVYLVVVFALAIAIGVGWTALRARCVAAPGSDARVHGWLRLYLRWILAAAMFTYGASKIMLLQFPAAGPPRLFTAVGDLGGASLVWTFMGGSPLYSLFTGLVELLAGILLLTRRTTTLGALVAVAAMVNVSIMNIGFEIGLSLWSLHLLAASLILVAPEARRLATAILGRAVAASSDDDHTGFRSAPLRLVRRLHFATLLVLFAAVITHDLARVARNRVPTPPPYGIYEVDAFATDGGEVPACRSETTRWRWLAVGRDGAIVERMDGSRESFQIPPDGRGAETITLTRSPQAGGGQLVLAVSGSERRLVLTGRGPEGDLRVTLSPAQESRFRRQQRPWRWMNDRDPWDWLAD